MEVEPLDVQDICLDLVSERKYEGFVGALLTREPKGKWVNAPGLCRDSGVAILEGVPEAQSVYVTWLDDPAAAPGLVVILFYDAESYWSCAASYNSERLLLSAAARDRRTA